MNRTPLGLKVDPKSTAVIRILQEIEDFDFSAITSDVQKKYKWSKSKAKKVELAIKRFFSLAFLDPGNYHIPEADADEYWHRLILHTQFYNDFCQRIFGAYYHHTPEPDPKLVNKANRAQSTMLFKYWYEADWKNLVRTCTQCKGPYISTKIRPAKETLPPPIRTK